MNRRAHPIDAHLHRLPLPSDDQAAAMLGHDAKQALFERITAMSTTTEIRRSVTQTRQRRMPRRTLVLATVLATLSVAAVGAAAVTWLAQDSTAVACHTGDGSVTVIDSVTGDPVVDCETAWRDLGMEPPALAAYDNGHGGIAVIPAAEPPEAGWQPLEPGVVQDPRLIQLDTALSDYGSGLTSDCHLLPGARRIAEGELERLGFEGWTVRAERGEADGTSTCTYYYLAPAEQEVVLIPLEGIHSPDDPVIGYARDLARALQDECMGIAGAARTARELAAAAGVADLGLVVREVVDDALDCARSDVNVGGRVEVIIRGPATTS